MAEQKHTPGPWQVMMGRTIAAQGSADTYSGVVWGGIACVLDTEQRDEDGRLWSTGGGVKANARLIAAAPELLEALRFVMEHGLIEESEVIAAAAIAKAEGGQ